MFVGAATTVTPGQLSVADGLRNVTFAPHLSTSLPTVMFAGQFVKVGLMLSLIVTVAEQVEELPLPSVTVKVTTTELPLTLPKSVPATGFCENTRLSQASVAVKVPSILGTRSSQLFTTTLAGQLVIVGLVTSLTVTVAAQTAKLFAGSLTVSVTMLSPTFEQLKLDLSIDNTPEQLSVLPKLTSSATIVAVPDGLRFRVMSLQTACGICVSLTSIVKEQFVALLHWSLAV